MMGKRTVFNALAVIGVLTPVLFAILACLCGCASGTAKGGDTQMERTTEKPSTRTYRVEVFGREPSPDEWAVLQRLGQPEVKK